MFVIFKCCSHFGATWSNSLLNASVVHSCVKCWRVQHGAHIVRTLTQMFALFHTALTANGVREKAQHKSWGSTSTLNEYTAQTLHQY